MKIHVDLDLSTMFASEFTEMRGSGYDAEVSADSSFLDAIKDSIRADVVAQVLAEWRKTCANEFQSEIKKAVETLKEGFLQATIQNLIAAPAVKKSAYGDEMVSLTEYTKECLAREFEQRKIGETVADVARKLGDQMGKQMRERFDMVFATQVVAKLHENKLLKDEAAAMLLGLPAQASATQSTTNA